MACVVLPGTYFWPWGLRPTPYLAPGILRAGLSDCRPGLWRVGPSPYVPSRLPIRLSSAPSSSPRALPRCIMRSVGLPTLPWRGPIGRVASYHRGVRKGKTPWRTGVLLGLRTLGGVVSWSQLFPSCLITFHSICLSILLKCSMSPSICG